MGMCPCKGDPGGLPAGSVSHMWETQKELPLQQEEGKALPDIESSSTLISDITGSIALKVLVIWPSGNRRLPPSLKPKFDPWDPHARRSEPIPTC